MNSIQPSPAQRIGRRVGVAAFSIVIATFVGICSTQILYQGFHSPAVVTITPTCREGVKQLVGSVRSARKAAASENLGERAAVERFRSALVPSWNSRSALIHTCQSDSWAVEALRLVEEWRWAEENAVRYESVDLAPSRRKIQRIESILGTQYPIANL